MWNNIQWGRQYFSCDYQELSMAVYNGLKVIVLDDDANKYKRIGCVMMSYLLPPYAAIEAEINQNYELAEKLYFNHLSNDNCTNIFAAILRALYGGQDIVIFISPDEVKNLDFAPILLGFLNNVFGLPNGSLKNPMTGYPPVLNPELISNRMDIMYTYGLIPFDKYCDDHPDVLPLGCVVQRVAHDVQEPNLLNLPQDQQQRLCGDIILTNRDQRQQLFQKFGNNTAQNLAMPFYVLHDWQR